MESDQLVSLFTVFYNHPSHMLRIVMPRRAKRIFITTCLLMATVLFSATCVVQLYVRCSNGKNRKFINDLCTLHRRGAAFGSMCHKLCDEGAFRYEQCGNNRWGKQVVIMTCDDCDERKKDVKIVLKSELDMPTWLALQHKYINISENLDTVVNYVHKRIVDNFQNIFGIDYSKRTQSELMSYMWNHDFEAFIKREQSPYAGQIAAINILELGNQNEYLSMKILENSKYLPRLYGTCGPAYFVEFTPSFTKLGYVLFQGKIPEILTSQHRFADWNERVEAALKILKLVKDFETSFHVPLHLCDIRSHNFAMNYLNDISLLDTDCIRFDGTIPSSGTPCTVNTDCDWMVCELTCNTTTHRCGSQRTNNNLQSICYYLFLSEIEQFGLLRNPPSAIEDDLRRTLVQCAGPTKFRPNTRWKKASWELLDHLETILSSSLSST